VDRRLLEALQNEFPLVERPYDVLARRLRISVDGLLARLNRLICDGAVRRMGASLNSHKLGFYSTLAAISVKPDLVEAAAKAIGEFPEVTHSYLRKDLFNIWFTIIAPDNERAEHILEQIRSTLSLKDSEVLNLPMTRLFKLDTRFKF